LKQIAKNILKNYLFEKLVERDYSFEVKENYKFVISYPKSGNTWMRFLLANLLCDEEIDFVNIEDKVIDIYKRNNKEIEENKEHLNIFKSHSYFRPKFSNNKVVYIVRDPRDVVISYYNHYKKNKRREISFNDYLDLFINSNIDVFGNWGENVGSWIGAKNNSEDFLLIKYEDMLKDTFKELKKVCNFFNINASDENIKKAVEKSKFNNLKNMEERVEDKAEATKKTSKKVKFFRKGKSRQWEKELSKEHLERIQNEFSEIMKLLDYDLMLKDN
jgi:hypothetical protein